MQKNLLTWLAIGGAAVAATMTAAACTSTPEPSVLTGTIAQQTFARHVTEVAVTLPDGTRQASPVDAAGHFALTLKQHGSYAIEVVSGDVKLPLALGGEHGLYLTSLRVTSGGALADIGSVRFYGGDVSADASGSRVPDSRVQPSSAACIDGYFEASSEPCMGQAASQSCSDEDNDDGEHGEHGGKHQHGHHDGDDNDAAELPSMVHVNGGVAVASYSLNQLGCDHACHDDDEDDDDSDD